VTARTALQHSLNVPVVDLLSALGPQRFVSRLRAAGAEIALPKDGGPPGLAVGLGGLGITLNDLAMLYTGLARGGEAVPLAVRPRAATPEGIRMVEPSAAWHVADVLRGAPPPANAPAGRLAFKTGTSYGYRDAWAVGFDRRYTVGVWVGRPDGAAVTGLVGRQVAAPLLFDAFSRLGGEPESIPAPRDALVATTAGLPPPLRQLRKDGPRLAGVVAPALKIAFPPDGARVDLGLAGPAAAPAPLAMKALGGVTPLTWLVNGRPVPTQDALAGARRQAAWIPDGAGFARVSVIDAKGATDSVMVRVE
jgi:penicillin-binding protein 1C